MKNAALLLCLALGLAACKEAKLTEFVAQSVDLKVSEGSTDELRGSVTFKHTTYWTEYRRVCDTYICGYDHYQNCHYQRECYGTNPRRCHDRRVCHPRSVPRYCQTNCRNEPYQAHRTEKTESPAVLKLTGVSGGSSSEVKGAYLGISTNGKFKDAVLNPSARPKGTEAIFNSLSPEDKNVLVLKGKGYKLVPSQDFLKLPAGFKAGDLVELEAQVEKTGDGKSTLSATGTKLEFPPLESSGNR